MSDFWALVTFSLLFMLLDNFKSTPLTISDITHGTPQKNSCNVCFFSSDIVKSPMEQQNQWVHVKKTFGPVSVKDITPARRGFRGACCEPVYPWAPPQTKETNPWSRDYSTGFYRLSWWSHEWRDSLLTPPLPAPERWMTRSVWTTEWFS